MFDPIAIGFEKLTAYKKAKTFHKEVQIFLKSRPQIDREVSNQLRPESPPIIVGDPAHFVRK